MRASGVGNHVCPWWLGFLLDNPLRRRLHNPERLFAPYVTPGSVALDLGCGMGWASLALARMVGPEGRVVSLDLQPQMLNALIRKARRVGLAERIATIEGQADGLDLDGEADFAVGFWMVHEVPDARQLLEAVRKALVPGGRFLVAEPRGHVQRTDFDAMIETAKAVGFRVDAEPRIAFSHAVVLRSA